MEESGFETENGRPRAHQGNIRKALQVMGITLSHDTFSDRLLVTGLDGFGPHLNEAAMTRLYLRVEAEFGFRPTKDYFFMVVTDLAKQNPFNPVVDHLDGLSWDGKPRLDRWLVTYGGADDTAFVRAVGAIVLIAAVRRARKPGCKFDEMLVLESPQGHNKSTALRTLAYKDEWFSDDLPLGADSKRQIEALQGHWIIEAGELQGLRNADNEHLKAFLSRATDKARMSYDRLVSEFPRRCVIIGTTNSSEYLKDQTGNRRFLPVRVKGFDIDALTWDRDQLWAEAVHREAAGESIRLKPSLYEEAAAAQEERHVHDPYFDVLDSVLGCATGKIRCSDIWKILEVPPAQRSQHHAARIGSVMKRLGYDRTKARFGRKNPAWAYVRGTAEERKVEIIITGTGNSAGVKTKEDERIVAEIDASDIF